MVDNRGVNPVSSFSFKSGDISGTAAKTSDEKYGQGGEYFASEMQEEENQEQKQNFQDRSAQLRASLDGLAMSNAGSIMLMKTLKKRELEKKKADLKKALSKTKEDSEFLIEEYEIDPEEQPTE